MRGRSRNALAPAQTVTTGWPASASRSAETSPVVSTPRCTPPMPPVAKTSMPAACASATEADTVVMPSAQRWAIATGTSRSATLDRPASTRSTSAAVRPTRGRPSRTAVTAGTAPPGADGGLAAVEGLAVARGGQTEGGEDGRLQGDDRAALGQGGGDLLGDDEPEAFGGGGHAGAPEGSAEGAGDRLAPGCCRTRAASTCPARQAADRVAVDGEGGEEAGGEGVAGPGGVADAVHRLDRHPDDGAARSGDRGRVRRRP